MTLDDGAQEIYLPIIELGLTPADLVTLCIEQNADALVGHKDSNGQPVQYISASSVRRALISRGDSVEDLDWVVSTINNLLAA